MNKILEKLIHVPGKPGVYLMRDEAGHIIYIGKAKNLKARLSSYFTHLKHPDTKTLALVSKVESFDYFVVATEKDALGLEANLIKKHKPHYNILLKDNKSFPYIRVVNAEFPYLEVTRKLKQNGKYFGPYFNGIWAKELLDVIQDVFQVRCCERFSREPCMNHQIEKCYAPCAGKISREDYAKIIDNVKSFLRGEKDFGARELLAQKMEKASMLQQFEVAIRYRNGINFLDKLKERTITQVGRDVNCDVFNWAARADIFCVSVLTVRGGKLIGIQNFANENKAPLSDEEKLEQFVTQYYTENIEPNEVIVSEKGYGDVSRRKVPTKSGSYKKKLLDMAHDNAKEYLDTSIEKIKFKSEFTLGACEELGQILGMDITPKKIECFDISHMGGESTVASMVTFIDGVAEKKLYRKFRIRHNESSNDYLSMQEVLKRRLARLGGSDDSFGIAPDLIIVDGGKGQLSAANEEQLTTNIKIIAFSENNEIFTPERIVLDKRSYALRLLQRIRDEAHRFANEYRKKLRAF